MSDLHQIDKLFGDALSGYSHQASSAEVASAWQSTQNAMGMVGAGATSVAAGTKITGAGATSAGIGAKVAVWIGLSLAIGGGAVVGYNALKPSNQVEVSNQKTVSNDVKLTQSESTEKVNSTQANEAQVDGNNSSSTQSQVWATNKVKVNTSNANSAIEANSAATTTNTGSVSDFTSTSPAPEVSVRSTEVTQSQHQNEVATPSITLKADKAAIKDKSLQLGKLQIVTTYSRVGDASTLQLLGDLPKDATVVWNYGDGAIGTGTKVKHGYGDSGVFNVSATVSTPDGAQANIYQQTIVGAQATLGRVFSVFTPNGDGKNDAFTIPLNTYSFFELIVTDLSGNIVFTGKDPATGWNGNLGDGNPAPSGSYYYLIRYSTAPNQAVTEQGGPIQLSK